MQKRAFCAGVALLALTGCGAPPTPRSPAVLPLRTLRLYETGVGYFERSGEIGAATATTLPVPAGHLDDALKSLVILNGSAGGQVSGLSFASSVGNGVARSRAGLPVEVDKPITYRDLLVSLKGERVEITASSGAVAGRLIEVTDEPDDAPPEPAREGSKPESIARDHLPRMVMVITLLTEQGEIAKLKGSDIQRVRPSDPAFAGRLDRALDASSTRAAQRNRPLSLLGDARGAITFGYIAETPIWRTTYRLLISPEGPSHDGAATGSKPRAEPTGALQGWALVHNDTDESWQGVGLSLVNGQPDSFLFPMAAPRYVRRSLLHPEDPLSTIPQLQDQTADMLWGDNPEGLTVGTASVGGVGYGSGSSHGHLAGSHSASAPTVRMGSTSVDGSFVGRSSLLSVGNLADLASASGVEHGALFTYTVDKPFSLEAHSSALVPFLHTRAEVAALAWFSSVGASARNAVRFSNTTGQTLPAGTLAVFSEGGFTGESALDRLKPGERRFIQFGNDLDAEVTEKKSVHTDVPKRLTFVEGRLEEHFLRTSRIVYELENRATTPRAFYVGLAVDRNATIKGTDGTDFDEEQAHPVLIFRQPAKQKAERTFEVTEGLSRFVNFGVIDERYLRVIAQHASLPPAEIAIVTEAAARMKDAETARRAVADVARDILAIEADVNRFREHLKALGGDKGGGGTAAAPLIKRLLDAEDRLAAAKKHREALDKESGARSEAVRVVLQKLGPPA